MDQLILKYIYVYVCVKKKVNEQNIWIWCFVNIFIIYSFIYLFLTTCLIWKFSYRGETARNIYKRINEHKGDIRLGSLNHVFFLHISKTLQNFDCEAAIMLAHIHNKSLKEILKAGAISL